ncbi:MAG: hypothetical protein Q7J29_15310 [Stagnimonas sp.]|nr:hypothetical protein [Stagnimonas sp.]
MLVDADDHGGDFQQRIAILVEAAGFDIHNDRQKPAKAMADFGAARGGNGGGERIGRQSIVHSIILSRTRRL